MTDENVQQEQQESTVEAARVAAAVSEATSAAPEPVAQGAKRRGTRKVRVGVVVSHKADKTVTVKVERRLAHPLYGKGVTRTKKVHAHDEKNEYLTGDKVRIMETRPLSKTKRWRVVELLERPE
jgi:small subunit ribosomal protein S17